MGISITGRSFSDADADTYARYTAIRAPQRNFGTSIQERNRLFKIADAERRGVSFGNDFAAAPEPKDIAPEWRTMYMIAYPGYEHVFAVAPGSFTVEGFGAELSEIPRPYNQPIVDIKAGKSRRVSFEFLLVKRAVALDLTDPKIPKQTFYINNFYANIEEEIKQLQLIADMGMPVGFDNVNAIMRDNYWYIDNLTFTYTRDNRTGETVSAQCNISLIEYKPLRQKFILLPKFRYGKFPTTKKPKTNTNTPGVNDPAVIRAANKLAAISLKVRNSGGAGSSAYG
jgi:hypothetical protein